MTKNLPWKLPLNLFLTFTYEKLENSPKVENLDKFLKMQKNLQFSLNFSFFMFTFETLKVLENNAEQTTQSKKLLFLGLH